MGVKLPPPPLPKVGPISGVKEGAEDINETLQILYLAIPLPAFSRSEVRGRSKILRSRTIAIFEVHVTKPENYPQNKETEKKRKEGEGSVGKNLPLWHGSNSNGRNGPPACRCSTCKYRRGV